MNKLQVLQLQSTNIKRQLVCYWYLLTFGRCPATPPAFFGTPKVSNEWLRTLIALLR